MSGMLACARPMSGSGSSPFLISVVNTVPGTTACSLCSCFRRVNKVRMTDQDGDMQPGVTLGGRGRALTVSGLGG